MVEEGHEQIYPHDVGQGWVWYQKELLVFGLQCIERRELLGDNVEDLNVTILTF